MIDQEKLSILIVDDLPANLLSLEYLLEEEELNIIRAASGEEALAMTLDHDFFLILMDVQMPGMNGYETAELLRGSNRTKNIPIIFVTANNSEEEQLFQGYDAGAVDYLVKPIAPQVLKSKVRIFKQFYQQQQELIDKTEHLNGIISELEELQQELEEKNEKLNLLSSRDGLTGLYNRRSFDAVLEEEWNRSGRSGLPLTLIMGDIDEFKAYNDTYGHVKGDDCLKAVAGIFEQIFRRNIDHVSRYGGEEFIALLPDTEMESACDLAGKLVRTLRENKIPHEGSSKGDILTISLGICTAIPGKELYMTDFLKCTDKALYAAKNNGRDRWECSKFTK